MFASDMSRGHGAGLINVPGDLAEAALRYVPRHRTQDATFFDAGDRDHPFSSPIMYGIVEQPGAKLDLRDIMDEGKILIVNLSKGRVGEDNAALLGAFFVNGIQQAAMSRADIAEPDRRDFSPVSVINKSDVLATRFQRRAPTEGWSGSGLSPTERQLA